MRERSDAATGSPATGAFDAVFRGRPPQRRRVACSSSRRRRQSRARSRRLRDRQARRCRARSIATACAGCCASCCAHGRAMLEALDVIVRAEAGRPRAASSPVRSRAAAAAAGSAARDRAESADEARPAGADSRATNICCGRCWARTAGSRRAARTTRAKRSRRTARSRDAGSRCAACCAVTRIIPAATTRFPEPQPPSHLTRPSERARSVEAVMDTQRLILFVDLLVLRALPVGSVAEASTGRRRRRAPPPQRSRARPCRAPTAVPRVPPAAPSAATGALAPRRPSAPPATPAAHAAS